MTTYNPLRRLKDGAQSLPAAFYQYSGVTFLYWAAMAATLFVPIFLRQQGFSAFEIGSMSSAFTAISIIAPLVWGVASDKMHSVKWVFAICLSASAVFWFILPHAVRWVSPLIVLLVLPVYKFFSSPTPSLLDSWIVQHVNRDRRVGFGPIRLWGSIGFAAMAFVYSAILKNASLDTVFYGYALLAAPCVILALCVREAGDGPVRPLSLREMQLSRVIKSKPFLAYLIFSLLINAPIMASFTFLPYLVQAVGESDAFFGALAGIEATLEIPMFFFSARLLKRFKLTHLIIACSCLYTVEMTLYSICRSPWQVLLVQSLHGLGYGLYLSSTVQYVFSLAPKNLNATAQTLASAASAVAGIIGNFAGGAIVYYFGVRVFFLYSGIFMLAVIAAYFIWLRTHADGTNPDGTGPGSDQRGAARAAL